MWKIFKLVYLIFSLFLLFYLVLPEPHFPTELPNSVKSTEPADLEEPTRQGYFTNMEREDVVNFYRNQYIKSPFSAVPLITFRLNYPPEEAQTLIRDQTASTFLEELAHPGREFLFINGYEPPSDKTLLVVEGKTWKQKVIVKYVTSSVLLRLVFGMASLILLYVVLFEWKKVWIFR